MASWKEKKGVPGIVGIKGGPGTKQKKSVVDDRDGSVGGHHIEHWDGRQDVEVIAKTHRVKARPQGDQ